MTKIFKFGGASIKDKKSINRVVQIIQKNRHNQLIIVFSAMGKVTNMLERIVNDFVNNNNPKEELQKIKNYHYQIIEELFDKDDLIYNDIDNLLLEIEWVFDEGNHNSYGYIYDQIVVIGELLSSCILSKYLKKNGFEHILIDARDIIRTNSDYQNASVDWSFTDSSIKQKIKNKNYITQGFISCNSENINTTLGREGSDFTAAILAYSLNAQEVTIWKDVPGLMNSDPKYFKEPTLFKNISFDEAIELAYYGAKVIHPRTIQPLKKKNIPLYIKSFYTPEEEGTLISSQPELIPLVPSFIVKKNQILLSISDSNLSFIVEDHISKIFLLLLKYSIRVNLMQNSAVSFSICFDNEKNKVIKFRNEVIKNFKVVYNENVNLYTIRNYKKDSVSQLLNNKKILLEQRSRNTIQLIAK